MTDRPWASGLVAPLLGAPPGMADWRIAELAMRRRILATWLSEVEVGGGVLGAAPAEFLARARRRAAALGELGADLAARHDVTVIRGAAIARHMPAGVLRAVNDVDLVAGDETTLWQVVLEMCARCAAVVRGLSVLRAADGDRQLGVWLKWPAEEPLLDKPMGVDVTTCTFVGDLERVPVRTAGIADPDLLSLFAVAEERLRRRFRVKDLVDLAVLVPALVRTYGGGLVDTVAGWATELCLAPELVKLSRRTYARSTPPDPWARVVDRLAEVSDVERQARGSGRRRLHAVRYGMALDGVPARGPALTVHAAGDTELALTPVGTFLLVGPDPVDAPAYRRGLAEAWNLHRRNGNSR